MSSFEKRNLQRDDRRFSGSFDSSSSRQAVTSDLKSNHAIKKELERKENQRGDEHRSQKFVRDDRTRPNNDSVTLERTTDCSRGRSQDRLTTSLSLHRLNEAQQKSNVDRSHQQQHISDEPKRNRASNNLPLHETTSRGVNHTSHALKHNSKNNDDDGVYSSDNKTPRLPLTSLTLTTNQTASSGESVITHPSNCRFTEQIESSLQRIHPTRSGGENTPDAFIGKRHQIEGSLGRLQNLFGTGEISSNRHQEDSMSRETSLARGHDKCSRGARSISLDRQQMSEAERKIPILLKCDRSAPVCVCSAASYYERERVNMEKKKVQMKEEYEALKKEAVLQRQQRQQITEAFLKSQTAEECLKAKEKALSATETVLKEESEKLERWEAQLRQDRDAVEALQLEMTQKEKDLEITRKRHERTNKELREQCETQHVEKDHLLALEVELKKKRLELKEEDQRLDELRKSLEEQKQEVQSERRQVNKRKNALEEAETESAATKARLERWSEDLKNREDTLNQQTEDIEDLKLMNEKHTEALKAKSVELESELKKLEEKRFDVSQLNMQRESLEHDISLWKAKREVEETEMSSAFKKKNHLLDEKSDELERKEKQLAKKEVTLQEFEVELNERANQLQSAERQLIEKMTEESKKEKTNIEIAEELKKKEDGLEAERRQLLKKKEGAEELEAEIQTRRDELIREKDLYTHRLKEIRIREEEIERIRVKLERTQREVDLREEVLKSEEKRSEWHRAIMQEVVDQKEQLDLIMQDFELEKQSFSEMKAAIEAEQERSNKSIKAREEALARFDLAIQHRARDVQRQETLLENRIIEESTSIKHKLLTVSKPSDNPVIRQTERLYQSSSSSLGSTRHRMPLLPLSEVNRPSSHRIPFSASLNRMTMVSLPNSTLPADIYEDSRNQCELTDENSALVATDGCITNQRTRREQSKESESRKTRNGRKRSNSKSSRSRKSSKQIIERTSPGAVPLYNTSPSSSCNDLYNGSENIPPSEISLTEVSSIEGIAKGCSKKSLKAGNPIEGSFLTFKKGSSNEKLGGMASFDAKLCHSNNKFDNYNETSLLNDDIDDALATPKEFQSSSPLGLSRYLEPSSKLKYCVKNCSNKESSWKNNKLREFSSGNSGHQFSKISDEEDIQESVFTKSDELTQVTNHSDSDQEEIVQQDVGLLGRLQTGDDEPNDKDEEKSASRPRLTHNIQGTTVPFSNKARSDSENLLDYFTSSKDKFTSLMKDEALLQNSFIDALDSPLL